MDETLESKAVVRVLSEKTSPFCGQPRSITPLNIPSSRSIDSFTNLSSFDAGTEHDAHLFISLMCLQCPHAYSGRAKAAPNKTVETFKICCIRNEHTGSHFREHSP